MTFLNRSLSAVLLVSAMSAATPTFATNELLEDNASDRPSVGAMALDAGIARPLMFVATVAGSALFVATLPFSIISGSVKEAAKTLVVSPANYTFRRCLGCSTSQDELKPTE